MGSFDIERSRTLLKALFAVACAALVCCFTMPFVTLEVSEKGKDIGVDPEDFKSVTVINYIHFATYQAGSKYEDLKEYLEEVSEDSYSFGEVYDRTKDKVMDFIFGFASGIAGIIIMLAIVALIAMSAYLLGVLEAVKNWDTSYTAMRLLSFVPLVIMIAMVIINKTILESKDTDLFLTHFNLFPLGLLSLVLPIIALNIQVGGRKY